MKFSLIKKILFSFKINFEKLNWIQLKKTCFKHFQNVFSHTNFSKLDFRCYSSSKMIDIETNKNILKLLKIWIISFCKYEICKKILVFVHVKVLDLQFFQFKFRFHQLWLNLRFLSLSLQQLHPCFKFISLPGPNVIKLFLSVIYGLL